jgi:pyruvyltransferase
MMQCAHVVSSSLHGLVFADAFGIPATWFRNASGPAAEEGLLKYRDHYASTGRMAAPALSLADPAPLPTLAREKLARLLEGLVDSFPYDRVCKEDIGEAARAALKGKVQARFPQ